MTRRVTQDDSTVHNRELSRELIAIIVDDSGYENFEWMEEDAGEDWQPPPREDDVARPIIAAGGQVFGMDLEI